MNSKDNLGAKKLVLDGITVLPTANVDILVQGLPFIPTNSMELITT
jgi:hypothetical protein